METRVGLKLEFPQPAQQMCFGFVLRGLGVWVPKRIIPRLGAPPWRAFRRNKANSRQRWVGRGARGVVQTNPISDRQDYPSFTLLFHPSNPMPIVRNKPNSARPGPGPRGGAWYAPYEPGPIVQNKANFFGRPRPRRAKCAEQTQFRPARTGPGPGRAKDAKRTQLATRRTGAGRTGPPKRSQLAPWEVSGGDAQPTKRPRGVRSKWAKQSQFPRDRAEEAPAAGAASAGAGATSVRNKANCALDRPPEAPAGGAASAGGTADKHTKQSQFPPGAQWARVAVPPTGRARQNKPSFLALPGGTGPGGRRPGRAMVRNKANFRLAGRREGSGTGNGGRQRGNPPPYAGHRPMTTAARTGLIQRPPGVQ
jgi:hypothetical protein